jgi:tetratricopeptide (TPR) repeat protein
MAADSIESMQRVFNVNLALTGSVERSGSRVRLTLSMADPDTGRRIATETLEEDMSNVSAFQSAPALLVAQMMELELDPETRARITEGRTNVTAAFISYLRGLGILSLDLPEVPTGEILSLLEEAASLDPLFPEAREGFARACTRMFSETGDRLWFDRAFAEIHRAIQMGPSETAYWVLSDLYNSDGKVDEAASALERAAQLAPRSGLSHFKLGRALERVGRVAEAEDAYQKSINLRPDYWPGLNRLALLHFDNGNYDAASNAWRQVTLCAPLFPDGYNYLGAIYALQGRTAEAQAMFERSIDVEPSDNFVAFTNLGILYQDEARFADAITMFERALTLTDENYQVWGNLGYAYAFSTEPDKARNPFLRAIELAEKEREGNPTSPELLSMLAGYYAMVDNRSRGLELLDDAVALSPREPRTLAIIGETYEDLGDRDRALEWIEKSLDAGINPERFKNRPMLRELMADERYNQMVERFGGTTASER